MDDTLEDIQEEPEAKSNQVHKRIVVLEEKKVDTIVIPLLPERRKHGIGDEVFVDLAHKFAVKHWDHDPSDAGGQIVVNPGHDTLLVLGNPGVIFPHEEPEGEWAASNPEAVQAVPSHGTGIVNITDKITGSVLDSCAFVAAINLCVVTHCFKSL